MICEKFPLVLWQFWEYGLQTTIMDKSTDRPELRERIVSAAAMLFQQYGIKQVRMDDVAGNLGISKKTLYGAFADKEAILLEVVKLTSASLCASIREILARSTNVLEQIFLLYQRIIEHAREINPLFFTELIRYSEVETYFEHMHGEHACYVKEWLMAGVKQGLLRDDIDYEVFLMQDGFQIDKLLTNPSVRKYPAEVIYRSVVLVLLRGMATEKGLRVIEELEVKS